MAMVMTPTKMMDWKYCTRRIVPKSAVQSGTMLLLKFGFLLKWLALFVVCGAWPRTLARAT